MAQLKTASTRDRAIKQGSTRAAAGKRTSEVKPGVRERKKPRVKR